MNLLFHKKRLTIAPTLSYFLIYENIFLKKSQLCLDRIETISQHTKRRPTFPSKTGGGLRLYGHPFHLHTGGRINSSQASFQPHL